MLTIIRSEEPTDAERIDRVTIEAFRNAPHTSHTEQFIVRELRLADALTVSLVAEADGEILGHVAVSPVRISDGADKWFGLGPVSVLPPNQRKGVGTQLIEAALERLRAESAGGCVVLGDPGYYGCFGFVPVACLWLPSVPPEYFQALVLRPPVPRGEVAYHPAFDASE
ncbi:GNAT family N-acetyltransferase [Paracidovorax citrulli]